MQHLHANSGIFEDNAFKDTYIDTTTQTLTTEQEAATKDKAGKESVTKLNIVNMGKVRTNPDLLTSRRLSKEEAKDLFKSWSNRRLKRGEV